MSGEERTVGHGRYLLGRRLGHGGMATVHLAWDTVLRRQVAVKLMHADTSREEAFRARFRREAQAVARLTHPAIVAVHDTGEDEVDGQPVPYMVMEYVDGRSLREELTEDVARHGAMPAEKALRITAEVLSALQASHEAGVVHRDVKPGNVMIARNGPPRVMDFGIARAVESGVAAMTHTGMVVGTPHYLSPEQALGRRDVDARADLYSTGVMLFELLTGRLPFDSDSPLGLAYAHVQEEPPPPSAVNSALPPAVDALVGRAMRKNPAERFASAAAMRAECLRIAEAGLAGAAPDIVAGAQAPVPAGSPVSQLVFPQFGAPVTPSPSVVSPYAPTPPPLSVTPSVPQAVPPAPGPAPAGRRRLPATAVAVALCLTVVAAVAAVAVLRGGDDGTGGGGGATAGADPAPSPRERRFREGDPEAVIPVSVCTDPEPYQDPDGAEGLVWMPDFYDVHIDSVVACLEEAGWTYETDFRYVDETLKGRDMVVDQEPAAFDPFDPTDPDTPVVLTVSTGWEPQ
jgi:serine/threonine protein kinase